MMTNCRSRMSVAAFVVTSLFGAVAMQSAGAASAPISGTATGTIGALGVPVPLPATAAFTGTHDDVSGAMNVTLTADDVSVSLPISGDTLSATASFANPGGFTGNASGDTASLDGSIKLTLTELSVPGFELPIPIGFLNCSLTFPLHLTGSWDAATGVVDVSQSEVAVPALPTVCALGIQAATQIDVNALLAQLPAGTVSLRLAIGGQPVPPMTLPPSISVAPTPTLSSSPVSSTPAQQTQAPAARPVSASPSYTG